MEYFTVKGDGRSEKTIEKSLFIASCKRVETQEEARDFINSVKKKYSNATHNCHAYKLKDGSVKFSDDGEPSGTAGTPILSAIESENLCDTAVVITRYFGGIKLGTGGLTRAYFSCTKEGLQASGKARLVLSDVYSIVLSYEEFSTLTSYFKEVTVINKEYSDCVKVEFAVEKGVDTVTQISNKINKKPSISLLKECFIESE